MNILFFSLFLICKYSWRKCVSLYFLLLSFYLLNHWMIDAVDDWLFEDCFVDGNRADREEHHHWFVSSFSPVVKRVCAVSRRKMNLIDAAVRRYYCWEYLPSNDFLENEQVENVDEQDDVNWIDVHRYIHHRDWNPHSEHLMVDEWEYVEMDIEECVQMMSSKKRDQPRNPMIPDDLSSSDIVMCPSKQFHRKKINIAFEVE